MTNALTKTVSSGLDIFDADVINTLRATVAKDLNPAELSLFLEFCKATNLNPFKREVWAIKAGGRLQIMTGINGFIAIANNHPEYDGMEVSVDSDEHPTVATAKVYRKDRKFPAVGVALLKEYGKDTPIWRQMPRVMLTKVAKSIALREAFPQELNGVYSEEEMPLQYRAPRTPDQAIEHDIREGQPLGTTEADDVDPDAVGGAYYYDLRLLEEEKRGPAQQLLETKGAEYVCGQVWRVAEKLKKLSRVLLDAAAVEAQLEHDSLKHNDQI